MKPPSVRAGASGRESAIVTDAITPEGEPHMGSSKEFMEKRGMRGKAERH